MKSKNKNTKSNQHFYKLTYNKLLVIFLALQFIIIIFIGCVVYYNWTVASTLSSTQTIHLTNNSLDNLYQDASNGSITEYKSGVTKWPEYGIKLPFEAKFGELYTSGYPDDSGEILELQFTNDHARSNYPPMPNNGNDMLERYFETLPYLQACSRLIVTVGIGKDVGMDEYKFEFSKTLQDGRSLDFYSSNMCNPELKSEFINYLKQLESL